MFRGLHNETNQHTARARQDRGARDRGVVQGTVDAPIGNKPKKAKNEGESSCFLSRQRRKLSKICSDVPNGKAVISRDVRHTGTLRHNRRGVQSGDDFMYRERTHIKSRVLQGFRLGYWKCFVQMTAVVSISINVSHLKCRESTSFPEDWYV